MLTLFFSAMLLSLIFNAAPGAVFAETVRQGLRGGFRPAFAVQVGSLTGDALWGVLGLAGVGVLLQVESVRTPVGILGAGYLLWLAWDSWRAANQAIALKAENGEKEIRQALRAGVLLSLTNPQNIAFWAALGSAMGSVGVVDPSGGEVVVFFAGYFLTCVLWCFFAAATVNLLFGRLGVGWAKLTYRACAIALLMLALSSLRELFFEPELPSHQSQNTEVMENS